MSVHKNRDKIAHLRELGFVDPVKTLRPAILGTPIDNTRAKIADLRELGVADPVKTITSRPAILGLAITPSAARSPTCASSASPTR